MLFFLCEMMWEQLDLFTYRPSVVEEPPDLNALFRQLNQHFWKGKLELYRCEWSNRMLSTWGICYRGSKLIRISTMFRERPIDELKALLCHEMIHIKYRGHGKLFHNELKRIGLAGDVQSHFPHLKELTDAIRRPLRYLYRCPKCRVEIKRRRKIRGYCAACHAAGLSSRFRLVRSRG